MPQAVIVPVTPFARNCSIVWCAESETGAGVDPGDWLFGDDATFVPGPEPRSTFGSERRSNPSVADRVPG